MCDLTNHWKLYFSYHFNRFNVSLLSNRCWVSVSRRTRSPSPSLLCNASAYVLCSNSPPPCEMKRWILLGLDRFCSNWNLLIWKLDRWKYLGSYECIYVCHSLLYASTRAPAEISTRRGEGTILFLYISSSWINIFFSKMHVLIWGYYDLEEYLRKGLTIFDLKSSKLIRYVP